MGLRLIFKIDYLRHTDFEFLSRSEIAELLLAVLRTPRVRMPRALAFQRRKFFLLVDAVVDLGLGNPLLLEALQEVYPYLAALRLTQSAGFEPLIARLYSPIV